MSVGFFVVCTGDRGDDQMWASKTKVQEKRTVYSCFLSTDEEAAASKRMEVLSTFSRNNEYPLSFLIEQTLRNTVFFLFHI